MNQSVTRRPLWLCTLGLLVVAAACSGGDEVGEPDSAGASEDDFCTVLVDGLADLDDSAKPASGSGGHLTFLAENHEELTALLSRLGSVAPAAVFSDMQAVASDWESEADALTEIMDDSERGTATALVRSLLDDSSAESVDEYAFENCGRSVFGPAVDADDLGAAPTTTTSSTTTTTTTAPPPEPVVVVCSQETLQHLHVGTESGEIRHETSDHSDSISGMSGTSFDGNRVAATQGVGFAVCGKSGRTLYSDDFRHIVGVVNSDDGTKTAFTTDLEAPTLSLRPAVSVGEMNDFGPSRPEVLAAGFTPDGTGLFWRESEGGSCSSYLAPSFTPGQTIEREDVPQYLLGEGGICFSSEMFVRWIGDTPLVCKGSLRVSCDDPNGSDVELPEDPSVTGRVNVDLPDSERYRVGHIAVNEDAFYVAETGLTYFVATDPTADRAVLFSWEGGDSQPTEVRTLGPGQHLVVGFIPATE